MLDVSELVFGEWFKKSAIYIPHKNAPLTNKMGHQNPFLAHLAQGVKEPQQS